MTWISELPPPSDAAVFFDFDGTLVDIAPKPDAVHVPPDLAPLLNRARSATSDAFAVVTGRSVDVLEAFLPTVAGTFVGGHGAQWRHAGLSRTHPLVGSDTMAMVLAELAAFVRANPDLLLETKPTGAVLHYRAAPELAADVLAFVADLAKRAPGLEHHPAKMAEELRPDDIGKDLAVAELMGQAPFKGRRGIFFGDDTADEAAMAWLLERGGTAVKVGQGDTCAPIRVDSPSALREGLTDWLR